MKLTLAQARALEDDGYLLLAAAAPGPRVDAALAAINRSLGEEGIAKDRLPELRARSFCPELGEDERILTLFATTPLADLAAAALGPGRVRTPTRGQIALRFPGAKTGARAYPHIDGMPTAMNGVPAGTLHHFSALGGVFLSDVGADDRGNLTVWPGSHHKMAAFIRTHGTAPLVSGFPDLDLGPARQLHAPAGSVLLSHYLLCHGIAPNHGPHVRYAVFFRLFAVDHESHGTAARNEVDERRVRNRRKRSDVGACKASKIQRTRPPSGPSATIGTGMRRSKPAVWPPWDARSPETWRSGRSHWQGRASGGQAGAGSGWEQTTPAKRRSQ